MSAYSGPQGRGAAARRRADKRGEAEARNGTAKPAEVVEEDK